MTPWLEKDPPGAPEYKATEQSYLLWTHVHAAHRRDFRRIRNEPQPTTNAILESTAWCVFTGADNTVVLNYGGSVAFAGIFFFSSRRRHTRFKCDWSSDVCSSD